MRVRLLPSRPRPRTSPDRDCTTRRVQWSMTAVAAPDTSPLAVVLRDIYTGRGVGELRRSTWCRPIAPRRGCGCGVAQDLVGGEGGVDGGPIPGDRAVRQRP